MNDVVSDGVEYYHLSATQDSPFNAIAAIGELYEFQNIVNGNPSYDIYISKVREDIMRIDMEIPFRGTIDGTSKKGVMTVSFMPTGNTGVSMEKPEPEPEEEPDDYEQGTIAPESNKYQNKTFDIQILGGDVFSFDVENTKELSNNYEEKKSEYKEEAYGSSMGVIVNISSIKAEDNTKENVMAKYLQDCMASNIMNTGVINIGSGEYVTSTADINETKTKTYCTLADDHALIITIYTNDSASVAAFEENMYSVSENPFWTEESWVLEEKYEITTPKGYSIVKTESSSLYACMRSTTESVDIFAIENGNIDAETSKETQPTGSEVKEVVSQEDVDMGANGTMRYIVTHSTDSGNEYYTYIGLIQKNNAVIKFYSVSASPDKDFKYVFQKFTDKIKDLTETQPEAAEETTGESTTETTEPAQ